MRRVAAGGECAAAGDAGDRVLSRATEIRRLQAQVARSAGYLLGETPPVLVGEGRVLFRDGTRVRLSMCDMVHRPTMKDPGW